MKRFGEGLLFFFLLILLSLSSVYSNTILTPDLTSKKITDTDNNTFIDPKVDYRQFMGRVSDKDDTGRILKIKVENNNTKFLKAGDILFFKVNNQDKGRFCRGSVRSVEDFYFAVYVRDFSSCWGRGRYFPRGMQLSFTSKILEQRVWEASQYRKQLLNRKDGFYKQLNGINNFLWTYDQQKLKLAAKYDQQINELIREKQLALDNLVQKKQENLLLQKELVERLDNLDESLDHYKVERQEYLLDRWSMDNDTGLPFARRPQDLKKP